jgi:hypothetical protein
MLLYEDILTGDEMFSDAFPLYVSAPSQTTLSYSITLGKK